MTDLDIATEHPAYPGHFPGAPILPGAVLLDETLHAIARARGLDLVQCRLTAAKFLAVVRPGDKLTLEHTATEDSKVRFVIRSANSIVASGMLSHGA